MDGVTINYSVYSASFATKTVANGKLVTVSGVTLSGGDAGNYTVSQPSGLSADITAKNLTISAVTNSKPYDANTSAAAIPTVSGLKGSDTVSGLSEAYSTKNGGTGN